MTQRRRRPASQAPRGVPAGEPKNVAHAATVKPEAPAAPAQGAPQPNMIRIDEEMLASLNAVIVRPAQVNVALHLIRSFMRPAAGNLGAAVTASRDLMLVLDIEIAKANAIAMRALAVSDTFARDEFRPMWLTVGPDFVPVDQLLIAAARAPLELPEKVGNAARISPAVLHALTLSALELPGPPGAPTARPAAPPTPPAAEPPAAEPPKPEGDA